ncbi:hypothetical protein R6Q59_021574 [Mikania micrantha]
MDGGNSHQWASWKNLKRRIGFGWKPINILGVCGPRHPNWVNGEENPMMIPDVELETVKQGSCIGEVLPDDGIMMNLATALVADRKGIKVGSTDWMTVKPLKAIARPDVKVAHDGGGGIGTLCCLCTERNKGAVLIPCGHTYCRVCSRSMCSKKQPCPLCNRWIMDILEIY